MREWTSETCNEEKLLLSTVVKWVLLRTLESRVCIAHDVLRIHECIC